jgi:hypothetical protein
LGWVEVATYKGHGGDLVELVWRGRDLRIHRVEYDTND